MLNSKFTSAKEMRAFLASCLMSVFLLVQLRPDVLSPYPGEALQGRVTITGTANAVGFVAYELAFAYPDDTTGTWFLITRSTQPVQGGVLGEWDTSQVTDGEYNLRLTVFLDNGNQIDVLVPGLRVRNYTPIETPTPAAVPVLPTRTLPPASPFPLPVAATPLPPNPVALTSERLRVALGYGAVGMLAVFLLLAVYLSARRHF
jgi:hypothetical protein